MARQTSEAFFLPAGHLEGFRSFVWNYFEAHQRDFLWRRQTDPYTVLVSEFMLQQTQTRRVEERLPSFLSRFPDIFALARAGAGQVLEEWMGLGYNRRALALWRTARVIAQEHQGRVPEDPEVLMGMPGIGPYTSRAIPCFAYNLPQTFIETNIRRVFLYHFFDADRTKVRDSEILPLISVMLDRKSPRRWYYALMDYGSALKKLVGNANSRGGAYRVQGSFVGSLRQIRGAVLRVLLNKELVESDLVFELEGREGLNVDSKTVREVLETLEEEGFLDRVQDDGQYCWKLSI